MGFEWPADWPKLSDIQLPADPAGWLKGQVIQILNWMRYEWPKTNEKLLDEWASEWSAFIGTVDAHVARLEDAVKHVVDNNEGKIPEALKGYMLNQGSNLDSLRSMSEAGPAISTAYHLASLLISGLRLFVIGQILLDAISFSAAIISGGASAAVSVLLRTGAKVAINAAIGHTINDLMGA